ncbi:uncharacterized protein LOC111344483 isoform X1 [Stylophora pistillata]|uniref:uncharacterized protein LOC111344483 isoform X1 n=1 Tax=Stylophora pistillata TaxID=50429 RepID=UPI000C0531A0|nr:uncharacterized protein LOC111344483 isoform X1 [Stylophora pistillata]
MATEQDGDIDSLVSRFCSKSDFFEFKKYKDKLVEYLSHVAVPAGWEKSGYRLSKEHPTYKYHKRLLENFIENQKLQDENQKSAGSTVTKRTPEVFVEQLKQFVKEAEKNDSFSEFGESERPALIDLLKENLKLCGVVVRKCTYSAHHYKASVLIKENCKAQDGHTALTEHVIDVKNESQRGYDLKVGDIVEVTQCRRKEGVAMEPEVIKCYQRDQIEIDSFLTLLSASEGSTAALTELARYLCGQLHVTLLT